MSQDCKRSPVMPYIEPFEAPDDACPPTYAVAYQGELDPFRRNPYGTILMGPPTSTVPFCVTSYKRGNHFGVDVSRFENTHPWPGSLNTKYSSL